MPLLMAADSSKVLKKPIGVSNGLDPDQDRCQSLSGANCLQKLSADDESRLEYDQSLTL